MNVVKRGKESYTHRGLIQQVIDSVNCFMLTLPFAARETPNAFALCDNFQKSSCTYPSQTVKYLSRLAWALISSSKLLDQRSWNIHGMVNRERLKRGYY